MALSWKNKVLHKVWQWGNEWKKKKRKRIILNWDRQFRNQVIYAKAIKYMDHLMSFPTIPIADIANLSQWAFPELKCVLGTFPNTVLGIWDEP